MTLSQLQLPIQQAFAALQSHPQAELLPIYRRRIYTTIYTLSEAHHIRSRLALITINRILPIWNSIRPHDHLPQFLLSTAEGVLRGTVSRTEAEQLAGTRNYAEDVDSGLFETPDTPSLGLGFAVLLGAAEALFETLGMSNFDTVLDLNEAMTDQDLDSWSTDTAGWGRLALAGGTLKHPVNVTQQQAYWSWWLAVAIPHALDHNSALYGHN